MKSFFLDGSALAKRYVAEPGTPLIDFLFDHVSPDRLVVLNIGVAEVVSVLVRRKNAGILSTATFSQALLQLGQEIIHSTTLRKVEATNTLVVAALIHIQNHSNRADSKQLSALESNDRPARIDVFRAWHGNFSNSANGFCR